jgi:hypothetical protein
VLQENTQLVSPPDRSSPEDVDVAVADFQSEDDVDPFGVTAQSTWKKCTASIVGAYAFRNRVMTCRGSHRRRRCPPQLEHRELGHVTATCTYSCTTGHPGGGVVRRRPCAAGRGSSSSGGSLVGQAETYSPAHLAGARGLCGVLDPRSPLGASATRSLSATR